MGKRSRIPTGSDLDTLNHAMVQLANAFYDIVNVCPKLYKVSAEDIEDELVQEQFNSPRIQLAKKISKAYHDGKMQLIDQVMDVNQNQEVVVELPKLNIKVKNESNDDDDHEQDENNDRNDRNERDERDEPDTNKRANSWPPPLPPIKSTKLKKQVFTHKSVVDKEKHYLSEAELLQQHNERLEFLGDAVLNFVMSDFVYRNMPGANEGLMTEIRSHLVRNTVLIEWAQAYKMNENLNVQQEGMIDKDGKAKKMVADVVEAYIGGVCLDSENGFDVARNWLLDLAEPTFRKAQQKPRGPVTSNTTNRDFKGTLYAKIGMKERAPRYVVTQEGNNKQPYKVECRIGDDDDVLGHGTGKNIKEAGQQAAEMALQNKSKVEYYADLRRKTPRQAPNTMQEPPTKKRRKNHS